MNDKQVINRQKNVIAQRSRKLHDAELNVKNVTDINKTLSAEINAANREQQQLSAQLAKAKELLLQSEQLAKTKEQQLAKAKEQLLQSEQLAKAKEQLLNEQFSKAKEQQLIKEQLAKEQEIASQKNSTKLIDNLKQNNVKFKQAGSFIVIE